MAEDLITGGADLATLREAMLTLRARAVARAEQGGYGYVVQTYSDWQDCPDWTDHAGDDDEELGFDDETSAQAYIDAVIEWDYTHRHRRWESAHAAWLPRHERYLARRALLEAHGLWTQRGEMEPLAYPGGPGPEPRAEWQRSRWRVVPYADSDRCRFGD